MWIWIIWTRWKISLKDAAMFQEDWSSRRCLRVVFWFALSVGSNHWTGATQSCVRLQPKSTWIIVSLICWDNCVSLHILRVCSCWLLVPPSSVPILRQILSHLVGQWNISFYLYLFASAYNCNFFYSSVIFWGRVVSNYEKVDGEQPPLT